MDDRKGIYSTLIRKKYKLPVVSCLKIERKELRNAYSFFPIKEQLVAFFIHIFYRARGPPTSISLKNQSDGGTTWLTTRPEPKRNGSNGKMTKKRGCENWGVDEDTIQRLHTYDWEAFKADRRYTVWVHANQSPARARKK